MNPAQKLIVLSEQIAGNKLHHLTDEVYIIGRTEDQSICIPDTTVSTQHCELRRNEDGTYNAIDLGSSNGTRINGIKITEQKLLHSDILQVGEIEVMYHNEDENVSAGQNAQTGINLEDTAGGLQIQDMGNVNPLKKGATAGDGKKARLVIYALIALLAIIVAVLAGTFILKLL